MSNTGKGLLERRLTLKMVVVQVLTIIGIFSAGVFPLTVYPLMTGYGSEPALDTRALGLFAQNIVRGENGGLMLQETPQLLALRQQFPEIWFYTKDEAGHNLTWGEVPVGFLNVEEQIDSVATLEIRPKGGEDYGSLMLRTEQSPAGPLRVMSGNGPTIGMASWVPILATSLGVAIVLVLTLVSAVVVPQLIRGELSGISTAASEAEAIDIDRRGTRLSTTQVPAEVRSLVTAVNGALSRLDTAYERRERFLADSAHELRTPIAIVQTRLETSSPFPEKRQLLLDVARLSGLAGQLLDLQRLQLGGENFERLDLADLAREVTGNMAPLAINNGYELSMVGPDEAVWTMGDARSLGRAVTNLVQNAIAYGGNAGAITVTVTSNGSIEVSDDGPGIPADERESILEPFYRLHPVSHGAGLGLNLVDEIVKTHRGKLDIADSATGGAHFAIHLPLATDSDRTARS